MFKNLRSYSKTFWALLKTDLLIYKQSLTGNIIDSAIWVGITTIVYAYFLTQVGINKDFGAFYLIGTLVTCALFELWPATAKFVADLEGNNTLSYFLTLPIPAWLVFVTNAISYAIYTIISSLIVLPLGKIILWNRFNLNSLSTLKFILIFISINLFCGFFIIFIKSIVKKMTHIGTVWSRVLFPMWILGGTQSSWEILYNVSPSFAYICLINPLLYANEGIRAAVLGQESFINFWACIFFLWLFGALLGFIGIKRLKKNLDFV